MLLTHADLKSGETVLIQGASGNVGGYAAQLARSAGARRLPPLITRRYVVIDTVGGDIQRASFDDLKRGGRLISSVSQPDADLATRYGVREDSLSSPLLRKVSNAFRPHRRRKRQGQRRFGATAGASTRRARNARRDRLTQTRQDRSRTSIVASAIAASGRVAGDACL